GMESSMLMENLTCLHKKDTVKFVVGSLSDLKRAHELINNYNLTNQCHVYFSPVYNQIHPSDIVNFMKEHRCNGVNLQLQLHKLIWSPEERGV
ncbi:MAG: 7-carboxy-7-deazaguanine synthase QueE, partial [Lachnoclostridium sp.]|nr:7-carboxy-7-deazaguanine synthase QueE [Lachnoclostridium sp.]